MTYEDAKKLSGAEINKRLDRLDKEDSANTDKLIDAGYGNDRPSMHEHSNDPLWVKYRAIHHDRGILQYEISQRYGPSAPRRLPRGFGARNPHTAPFIRRKRVENPYDTHAHQTTEQMRLEDSIRDGLNRLKHGRDVSGKKYSIEKREAIARAVESSIKRLKDLPHLV